MYLTITYKQRFDDLLMYLRNKYPDKLFDLEGIGEQLDLNRFSRNFFSSRITADSSIDSNSNVDDISVIVYNSEISKPLLKINSYYILWKKLVKLYGYAVAADILEKQLTGDIYIHDFHGFAAGQSYSYYAKTTIITKKDEVITYTTMDELFKTYGYLVNTLPDRDTIDLKGLDISILDKDNKFVRLECVLRHKTDKELIKLETKNGYCTIVTSNHPVILEDGSEKQAGDLTINDRLKVSNSIIPISEDISVGTAYAYFVGFLLGDGNVHARALDSNGGEFADDEFYNTGNTRSGSFAIYQKDIIESFIYKVCNSLFDNVSLRSDRILTCGYKNNAIMLNDIGDVSQNKKLPRNILSWKEEEKLALIAGLIDSDGNINNTSGVVNIRVNSFALVQQIGELSRSLGLKNVRTSLVNNYESTRVCYNQNYDMYRVSFRCNNKTLAKYSEKIRNNLALAFNKPIGIDGRWETSKLNKIQILTDEVEYVYDVTTETGTFHSNGLIQHNCFNYSTYDIMLHGLPMVKKVRSLPPKYLYAFKSQLEQFTVIASNSIMGATGLADMLIVISYYVDKIMRTGRDAHFELLGTALVMSFTDIQRILYKESMSVLYKKLIPTFDNKQSVIYVEKGFESKEMFESLTDSQKDIYDEGREMLLSALVAGFSSTQRELFSQNVYRYVRENLASFIYTINQPMRSNQSLVYDEDIVVGKHNIKIGALCEHYLGEGEYTKDISSQGLKTYSLNRVSGMLEEKAITAVHKHITANKLVKYNLSNGQSVSATDNHSFFTRQGLDIVEVQRGENPKNLLVPYNFCKSTRNFTIKMERHGGRINWGNIEMDPKMSYLIGQYIGDGNIDGSVLSISTYNELVARSIKKDFEGSYTCTVNDDKCVNLSLGRDMLNTLIHVFGKGSRGKRIPRGFYECNTILHLIGGYIDADGHISEMGITLTSVNKNLLSDVQYILLSRGIFSTLHTNAHEGFNIVGTMYRLTVSARDSHKLNKYTRLKKFTEREVKYDYSRQNIDFDGLYKVIKEEYDIHNPKYSFSISDRSRDIGTISYKEVEKICSKIKVNLKKVKERDYEDSVELSDLLFDSSHRRTPRRDLVKEWAWVIYRVECLKELLIRLEKFLFALPVRVLQIEDIPHEPFVYDISVEDNENFLTSSNVYAHNSPFTNVSIYDSFFLDELSSYYIFPDGSTINKDTVWKVQTLYLDIMNEEMRRTPITFPVTTACFSVDDDKNIQDHVFLDMISNKNMEFAYINTFFGKSSVLSSCCRLRSDMSTDYFNSMGAGSTKIGSLGVCSINFPRLAINSKGNQKEYFSRLVDLVEVSSRINNAKRRIVKKRIDNGNLPLYTYEFMQLERQYSTTGINGLNECVELMGLDVMDKEGQDFVIKTMVLINDENLKYEKKYNAPHNCEQVPGESMSVKMALKDKLLGYQDSYDIYSNQFIPLSSKADLLDRIKLQGMFDSYFSGGAACHLNIESRIEDVQKMKDILITSAVKGVVYCSVNYCLAECTNGHMTVDRGTVCSICGEEIVNYYTRVVGFVTNTKNWVSTRREKDFPTRVWY